MIKVKRIIDGFVDDTTLWVNDFKRELNLYNTGSNRYASTDAINILHNMIDETSQTAQWWENLLWSTGGELELSKCFFYVMHWYFDEKGQPQLANNETLKRLKCEIKITESATNQEANIRLLDSSEDHTTLGVKANPTGDSHGEAIRMKNKSKCIATGARTSALSRTESWSHYKQKWLPVMQYSLLATALTPKQCKVIETQSNHVYLNPVGFPKSFPVEMVTAPQTAGGVGFRS